MNKSERFGFFFSGDEECAVWLLDHVAGSDVNSLGKVIVQFLYYLILIQSACV